MAAAVASAWQKFQSEWPALFKLAVSETTVDRASSFAWDHGLRDYDAVHLASASEWQEALGDRVTLATFDKQLWQAGEKVGLLLWPEEPDGL
jgi:uncharacterized protein